MRLSDIHTNKTKGQIKVKCPECKDERSNKADKSLSVNLDTGLYRCHYCGTKGMLDEFKKAQGLYQEKEDDYQLPKLNTTGLGDKALNYLVSRGISVTTINENQITESPKGWIEFNYYELDELVNVKYRSVEDKKFMQFKGGKPILYGLNDIIQSESIIITEGEIDKLSIWEAGFKNCVSVPMGAPNPNDTNVAGKLKCFEYAGSYFDAAKEIIIAVDNDKNGERLKDEIARRFGKEKCKVVDFGIFKDANEVLVKVGKEKLHNMIVQASWFPIDGVVFLSEAVQEVHDLYLHGIPEAHSVNLGNDFDNHYKVKEGYLTIVTGVPTHGKSNFVEHMVINLVKNLGWKFGSYSPEHYPLGMFFQRLARIYTGKSFFEGYPNRMDRTELVECFAKLNKHIFPTFSNEVANVDTVLETMGQLVLKYGIKGVVIDPWTDLELDLNGESETQYVKSALAKIKRFNQKYDVHTWLIVHPKKMHKLENGAYAVPTLYDCSGSANFYNRADFGMTVYRNPDNTTDVHIQKVKFEGIYGTKGKVPFAYDVASCRYLPAPEFQVEQKYEVNEMF